jgi:predicted acetyltransferase
MAEESFPFGFDYNEAMPWRQYLDELERKRDRALVPEGRVPSTFLVADVGGEIVGRSSIRHELNAFLAHEGGHIGYCVLPSARGCGYSTVILRQSLSIARNLGINRALLCCDDDNIVSARTIERCGGLLDSKVRAADGSTTRRYWIDNRLANH